MRARTVGVGFGLAGVLALAGAAVWGAGSDAAPAWRTAPVERADVTARASATGSLQAVTTVQVGTQISGILSEVLADFNDHVTKGQVLARIDTTLLAADVASAAARAKIARVQLERQEQLLVRVAGLAERGSAAQQELDMTRADRDVAKAELASAEVTLRRARSNLDYATIAAPIDGTVIRRDVEQGQTVNAGMSAPTLFVLAGDLQQMQILASVDEADIGRVRAGQAVEFTVPAFPDRQVPGTVEEVRLQSANTENVVSYTTVVAVENADGALLPGMTATVDFLVESAEDVLCVPSAALRFRPEPAAIDPSVPPPAPPARGARGAGAAQVWVVGDAGLRPISVQPGLAGPMCTQVGGDGVTEGLEVVLGPASPSTGAPGAGGPFGQPAPQRRPGGF